VDTYRLDQRDGTKCVIGQLFEYYSRGIDILDIDQGRAQELGFDNYDGESAYAHDTLSWKFEIESRLAQDTIAVKPHPGATGSVYAENVTVDGTFVLSSGKVIKFPAGTPLNTVLSILEVN